MGDKQFAVVRNSRPAAVIHDQVVQRQPVSSGLAFYAFQFFGGYATGEHLFQRRMRVLCGRLSGICQPTLRKPCHCHSQQSTDYTALKTVARISSGKGFLLQPTATAAADVGVLQVFLGEGLLLLEQFDDSFGELSARSPSLVDAGTGKHVGASGALANAGVAVAGEEWLAVTA